MNLKALGLLLIYLKCASAFAQMPTNANEQPIIVAIVDTGIDLQNKNLNMALWHNPGELGQDIKGGDKSTNGIDDDQNGFVDDFQGWNFSRNNSKLHDLHGHGTHIAGLILKNSADASVKLMVLKYFDASTPNLDTISASTKAMRYAIQNGAQIINFSGGGREASAEELAVLQEAQRRGILVVAAAGNERQNTNEVPFYPASYQLDNIISVAALDREQQLVSSSNFGTRVDTAALGQAVISDLPNKQLGAMTGTSQATAQVTGMLVQYFAQQKLLPNPATIKRLVQMAGTPLRQLSGKTTMANAFNLSDLLSMKGENDSLIGGPITN